MILNKKRAIDPGGKIAHKKAMVIGHAFLGFACNTRLGLAGAVAHHLRLSAVALAQRDHEEGGRRAKVGPRFLGFETPLGAVARGTGCQLLRHT